MYLLALELERAGAASTGRVMMVNLQICVTCRNAQGTNAPLVPRDPMSIRMNMVKLTRSQAGLVTSLKTCAIIIQASQMMFLDPLDPWGPTEILRLGLQIFIVTRTQKCVFCHRCLYV